MFVDEANLTKASWQYGRKKFDWNIFKEYFEKIMEGVLFEVYVYVGLPPRSPEWINKYQQKSTYTHYLRSLGYQVIERVGIPRRDHFYKANVDVVLSLDAMQLCLQNRPASVVLCSGDSDYSYLVSTLRRMGIRVYAAAPEESMAVDLKVSATGVIDLTDLFERFTERLDAAEDPVEYDA
jgi:uncharacterized LabA/DUF88 family protein